MYNYFSSCFLYIQSLFYANSANSATFDFISIIFVFYIDLVDVYESTFMQACLNEIILT